MPRRSQRSRNEEIDEEEIEIPQRNRRNQSFSSGSQRSQVSQNSRRRQKRNISSSQPGPSLRQDDDDNDFEPQFQRRQRKKTSLTQVNSSQRKGKKRGLDVSQPDLEGFLNSSVIDNNIEEYAVDILRYFLFTSRQNMCVRKAELQKNVVPKVGRQFNAAMQQANKMLKEVYGLKLCCLDSGEGTAKYYVLDNILPTPEIDVTVTARKVLLLLILSHIYMSQPTPVTENSLYTFLEALDINVYEKYNETYGDIKDYIENSLTKQKYINKEHDEKSKQTIYSWGPRAEGTIYKMEVLNFVSEFYKIPSKSWTHQYQMAKDQNLDEERY